MSRGRRLVSPHLTAIIPEKANGYAVIVSKKTARLAVTRHQVKRRILEALRALGPLPGGIIVIPKPSATRLDYHHIRDELATLLCKIG